MHLLHVRTSHEDPKGPTFHVSLDDGPEVSGPTEDAATARLLGLPMCHRNIVNSRKASDSDAQSWDRVLTPGDVIETIQHRKRVEAELTRGQNATAYTGKLTISRAEDDTHRSVRIEVWSPDRSSHVIVRVSPADLAKALMGEADRVCEVTQHHP